jgi:hypothetical protein
MPDTPSIPTDLPLPTPALANDEPMQPPSQSETPETPEIPKEQPLMFDVHLPQHTHTWRDFWIHLGTITVGLLIAVGLEQAVEKVHHLEQGRQLARDLQKEAQLNRQRLEFDSTALDKEMAWLLRLRRDVSAIRGGGSKQNFVYPQRLEIYPTNPNRSSSRLPAVTVWNTAKESNLIQLLPTERARNYNEVYREADLATDVLVRLIDKWLQLDSFELRLDNGAAPGKPNVAKMTTAQLDEYSGVIGDVYLACKMAKRRVKVYEAWNESILAPPDKPFESSDEFLKTHPDPPIDLSK